MIKNYLHNFSIILFSFLLFIGFVWFRFLQERLPNDIPLKLTDIRFVTITTIIIVYIISIKSQLISHKNSENLKNVVNIFFKPIDFITDRLFAFAFIQSTFIQAMIYLYQKNIDSICKYTILVPRLLLINAFIIDVFYFNQFKYIYMVVFISIPLLLNTVITHMCRYIISKNLEIVNHKYTIGIFNNNYMSEISSESLILVQAMNDINKLVPIEYYLFITFDYTRELRNVIKKEYPNELNLRIHNYYNKEELEAEVRQLLIFATLLQVILLKIGNFNKKYQHILLAITLLYLISWSYILIVSIHTLTSLPFLSMVVDVIEPFSGLYL